MVQKSNRVPTRSGLTKRRRGATVPVLDPNNISADELAAVLKADRIARKLSWDAYALFLRVPLATIYKIARGLRKRPHELTKVAIIERINEVPVKSARTRAEGAIRDTGPETTERPS